MSLLNESYLNDHNSSQIETQRETIIINECGDQMFDLTTNQQDFLSNEKHNSCFTRQFITKKQVQTKPQKLSKPIKVSVAMSLKNKVIRQYINRYPQKNENDNTLKTKIQNYEKAKKEGNEYIELLEQKDLNKAGNINVKPQNINRTKNGETMNESKSSICIHKTCQSCNTEASQFSNKTKTKIKFEDTYARINRKVELQKQKYEELKKQRREMENRTIQKAPKININSKKIYQNSEPFLDRGQTYEKASLRRKGQIIQRCHEEETRKINKGRVISQSKFNKTRDINKSVDNLFEWNIQRLNKIDKKREELERGSLLRLTEKPQINKNSIKITNSLNGKSNRSTDEVVNQLYKEDIKAMKERKTILCDIGTPSFKPILNEKSQDDKQGKQGKKCGNQYYILDYACSANYNNGRILREKINNIKRRNMSQTAGGIN